MNAVTAKAITIYTSGACPTDPGPGGYTATLAYDAHRKTFSAGYRWTTTERMALMAAIIGLTALKESCQVTLYSPAQSLVNAITQGRLPRWHARNWQQNNQPMSNADLWQELYQLSRNHELTAIEVQAQNAPADYNQARHLALSVIQQQPLRADTPYEKATSWQPTPIDNANERPSHTPKDITLPPKLPVDHIVAGVEIRQVGAVLHIPYGGQVYIWDGQSWSDKSYVTPPTAVIQALNGLLADYLAAEDQTIADPVELLRRAVEARDATQHSRAEQLARRVLDLIPGHPPALAILCATLRARGKPQQALAETQEFAQLSHAPLLTSRAAALCDLQRWSEAKRVIGRALALGKSEEAFNVVKRIKAAQPHLYP